MQSNVNQEPNTEDGIMGFQMSYLDIFLTVTVRTVFLKSIIYEFNIDQIDNFVKYPM